MVYYVFCGLVALLQCMGMNRERAKMIFVVLALGLSTYYLHEPVMHIVELVDWVEDCEKKGLDLVIQALQNWSEKNRGNHRFT